MTTYDFVHLVIHAAGGQVRGRTKLQKTVYFVGVLTGQLPALGFRPHYYGPYSPAVAGAVQELRGLRFLEQKVSADGTTDERGFEVTRYEYILTEEGKQVAAEKAANSSDDWKLITGAVQRLRAADIHDYVRLAIAAKTHLLSQQAGTMQPDVLKAKASEHGWAAFTDEQYSEAVKFLEVVVGSPPGRRTGTR
jgi:uncharacterized protein YwgA